MYVLWILLTSYWAKICIPICMIQNKITLMTNYMYNNTSTCGFVTWLIVWIIVLAYCYEINKFGILAIRLASGHVWYCV